MAIAKKTGAPGKPKRQGALKITAQKPPRTTPSRGDDDGLKVAREALEEFKRFNASYRVAVEQEANRHTIRPGAHIGLPGAEKGGDHAAEQAEWEQKRQAMVAEQERIKAALPGALARATGTAVEAWQAIDSSSALFRRDGWALRVAVSEQLNWGLDSKRGLILHDDEGAELGFAAISEDDWAWLKGLRLGFQILTAHTLRDPKPQAATADAPAPQTTP